MTRGPAIALWQPGHPKAGGEVQRMQRVPWIGTVLVAALLLSGCGASAPPVAPTDAPSAVTPTAGPTALPTVGPSPAQTALTASLPPLRQVQATTITLPGATPFVFGIIADPDAIWVAGEGRIYRIDPTTNQVAAEIPVPISEFGFAVAEGSAWIADFDGSQVLRLDLATGDEVAVIPVGVNPAGIVAAFGSIWTADHRGGTVSRIDTRTNRVSTTIEKVGFVGPSGPQGIAAGSDRIWVGVPNARMVFGIDPSSHSIVAAFPVGRLALPCGGILVDVAAIWVSSCHEQKAITVLDPDDGSSTIVGLPAFAGQPVRIGELVWVPVLGGVTDPILIAFGAEDATVADAIAIPPGSEPDSAVNAFGSLWITGPTGSVLRLSLTELGG
ncbi:MAG TPA: YncE family protein [Candidatus Eisenbacteria bacterium]|nr:YncE family protein [Candidatus Eisenbacteria bacterium]